MASRPDPAFFTDLNRRIQQGQELARQNRFGEAQTVFYGVLEFAAAQQVTVPISLIFDQWRDIAYCCLGLNDLDRAERYLRAVEALAFEWDEHQRAGRNRQTQPPAYKSIDRVRPLIPASLAFVMPDTFDPRRELDRWKEIRKITDPALHTLDDVLFTLWYFAGFYCGVSKETPNDFNWVVVKDWLAYFSPNQPHKQYDAGMLHLNRAPVISIGAALVPDGCWVVLLKEITLPELNRKAQQPVREATLPANKRALWTFLNDWIKDGVLIPSGDRFKVSIP